MGIYKHIKQQFIKESKNCEYSAAHRGTIRAHFKRIHQKLKEYQCNICDKMFFIKVELQNHVLKIHENGGSMISNNKEVDTERSKATYKKASS